MKQIFQVCISVVVVACWSNKAILSKTRNETMHEACEHCYYF